MSNTILDRAINVASAFAGIIDNLICIITLGGICTAYEMRVLSLKSKLMRRVK